MCSVRVSCNGSLMRQFNNIPKSFCANSGYALGPLEITSHIFYFLLCGPVSMLVFTHFIPKIATHSADCELLLMIGLSASAVDALDIFLAIVAVLGTRSLGRAITMPDASLAVPACRHALKKAPLQHLCPHDKTVPHRHAHVFPARLCLIALHLLLTLAAPQKTNGRSCER